MSSAVVYVNRVVDKVDSLQYRERLLLLVTIVVLLMSIWDYLFFRDEWGKTQSIQNKISASQTQLDIDSASQRGLVKEIQEDPGLVYEAKLKRYEQEIVRIDQVLKEKTLEFISPQQMIQVLESLIQKESGLDLISLTTTGSRNLLSQIKDHKKESRLPLKNDNNDFVEIYREGVPNVYMHGLKMKFEGDYISALNYVRRIESLRWRFSWSSLVISMEGYPITNVTIELETLSLNEGWIGV